MTQPEFKLNVSVNQAAEEFSAPGTKTFIFVPADGKDMRAEYPELNTVDAFVTLSNAEMIFVWLLANKTSPLHPDNFPKRSTATKKALEWSKLTKLLPLKTLTD